MLFAIAGCDFVFQLEPVSTVGVPCGPYTTVTEVTITGVSDARNFSISADGELALVFGRIGTAPRRPIPLRNTGAAWEPHPDPQAGLDQIISPVGANLAPAELTPVGDDYVMSPPQPVMMVWSGTPNELARYYFAGTQWVVDPNMTPVTDGDYDVRAGNVIVVTGGGGVDDIVRHTVQVKRALDPTQSPNQILLSANSPPRFNLVTRPDRTRPLNEAQLETSQAVLSDDMRALVYAAKVDADSDLFAVARSSANDFAKGGELIGVNTAADELEPWIDATCSKLYFRRAPAGQPNDAGQIFVAE